MADASVGPADRWSLTPRLRCQLLAPSPGPWHPYLPDADGAPRRLRQGHLRVAGPGGEPRNGAVPARTTRFLDGGTGLLHTVEPAAVPAGGLRLECRWVLVRSRSGVPVVWQQRRRLVPLAPPAFLLGHDDSWPE